MRTLPPRSHRGRTHAFLLTSALGLSTQQAWAIRPFVTDDARVVGDGLAQVETWFSLDPQFIEHNALFALGPTPWLELTAGFVQSIEHTGAERGAYSFVGPVLQGKALLLEAENNARPGLAFAAGVLPPAGVGNAVPHSTSGFGYLALTESIEDEWILFHANLGLVLAGGPSATESQLDWHFIAGLAAQLRVAGPLHALAEVYYGDPFDPLFRASALQLGARYVFSEELQVDGAWGTTIDPGTQEPGGSQWGTLGLRWVTPQLW